jgi:hypothetical protein
VTIINENNIWAVGEIKTDSGYYGAAHWDGVKWKMVNFVWDSLNIIPIRSLWSYSYNDLWIAAGSIFHWNGSSVEIKWFVSGLGKGINSIWSNKYSNLYFVGGDGTIINYSEGNIVEISSGTNIDLKHISGNEDDNLFITGYDKDLESTALELKNNNWTELYHSSGLPNLPQNNYGRFLSVWCGDENAFFITVGGLLKFNLKNRIDKILSYSSIGVYPFYTKDINGQAENDFFMVDNNCRIVIWNGKSWSIQNEIFNLYPDERLYVYGSDYKQNIIAIVGEIDNGSQGFIAIGKKY